MSNIIPPLLSNSPPPPPSPDEEDDDEFGDFTGHIDCSYSCDNLSLPSTPEHSPTKVSILNGLDINFNTDSESIVLSKEAKLEAEKDFQDKRKCDAEFYVFMPTTVEEQEVFNKFNELDIKTELMQPLEDLHKNSSDDGGSSVKTNLESNIKNGIIETDFKQLSIKDDEIEFTDGDVIPKDNPVHCYENNHLSENLETQFCDSPGDNTELNSTKFTILEMLNPPSSTNIPAISTFDTSCEALVEDLNKFPTEVVKSVNDSVDTDKQNGSNQSLTNIEQKQLENIDDITNTQLNSDSKSKSSVDDFKNIDYAIKSNSESVTNEHCLNSNIDQSSHLSSDDEFGEFADFNSHKNIEDNSDDFGDFTSTAVCLSNEEDFGNFAIFPEPEEPVLLLLDEKQAFEKANDILKEMFPIHEEIQEYFEHFVYEKEDFIFNKLQDITDTPALGYQWSKSASQKMLLMSLGIDARNILYGPSWNPSMPGFAANLSLEPLQPVKSECLSPSVEKSNQSPSVPIPPPTVDIPSVQFDWNSSGLTNPLDSVSKDSANEPSETFSNLGKPPLATRVLEAELVPKKVASKSDLEEKPEDFDDFDDFASFQCSTVQPPVTYNWSNAIPLRETYISNDNTSPNSVPKELPLDVEAWLQPTIVTPELPRKRSIDQEGELSNMCIAESGSENIESNIDDDLDDFQMALPEPKADILKDLCKSDILSPVNTQENK